MSDSIGSAMQVQATAEAEAPSLAQWVAARDAAPKSQTDPAPTEEVHLSDEARATVNQTTESVAQKATQSAQASLDPIRQIAKTATEEESATAKSIHVVA